MRDVSQEEFDLDPAHWQRIAQEEPLVITDKGQPKLYLLSKEVFDSLYVGSREALMVSDLGADDLDVLMNSKMSSEHDHLDALLQEDEK